MKCDESWEEEGPWKPRAWGVIIGNTALELEGWNLTARLEKQTILDIFTFYSNQDTWESKVTNTEIF